MLTRVQQLTHIFKLACYSFKEAKEWEAKVKCLTLGYSNTSKELAHAADAILNLCHPSRIPQLEAISQVARFSPAATVSLSV